MSIFKANLDNFATTYYVAPIDTYELEILKYAVRKQTVQNEEIPIVTVSFRIESGDNSGTSERGKPVRMDVWLRSEDDFNRLLRMSMCALGIMPGTPQGDADFKARFGDLDWSVDPDSGVVGSAFEKTIKGRVQCKLSSKADKTDPNKFYQQFGSFLPA